MVGFSVTVELSSSSRNPARANGFDTIAGTVWTSYSVIFVSRNNNILLSSILRVRGRSFNRVLHDETRVSQN